MANVASPISQDAVVSPNPSDKTPRVQDGAVYKMLYNWGITFVGGQFTSVKNYSNTGTYSRNRLFAFNPVTGGLTGLLTRRADDEDGARTAIHKKVGPITLSQMLHEWTLHDLGHIRQIAELVRARKYIAGAGPLASFYHLKP